MTILTRYQESSVTDLINDLAAKANVIHTHADGSEIQKVNVRLSGTLKGTRKTINFIAGSGVSITIADDSANDRVNITVSASGPPP